MKIFKKSVMIIAIPLTIIYVFGKELKRAYHNFHFIGGVKSQFRGFSQEWSK